jgi:hypothetical protein
MITDDLVEVACVAAGLRARRDGPSKRCAEREMRAALTAVLPMIRDEVLEEAAKVAEAPTDKPARCREDIAEAIRAMKGTSHDNG